MSNLSIIKWVRIISLFLITPFLLFFGLLALGTVPAPNARNSEAVTGKLLSVTAPHPEFGDMSIVLDSGRSFYVNRANEVDHFEWEAFLAEARPGDEVTLTAVNTAAKRWFGFTASVSPLAGVATPDKVYMDPAIASQTWQSQRFFSVVASYFLAIWIAVLLSGFVINNQNFQDRLKPKPA